MAETFTCEIQARMRDINLGGHVDNVEAIRVLDEARLLFLRYAPLPGLPPLRTGLLHALPDGVTELVVSQQVNYRAEMRFVAYQPFLVTLWISRVGRTSFAISGELRVEKDGAPAVVFESTTVLWQPEQQEPWPIDNAVRAELERYMGEPVAGLR